MTKRRSLALHPADCDDRDDRQGTEVCKFSRLEDQIITLLSIPSITGEEGASHCFDSVVPTGTVKVAGLIPLLSAYKNSATELMADRDAGPENLRGQ